MIRPEAFPRRPRCLVVALTVGSVVYVLQTNRPYRGRVRLPGPTAAAFDLHVALIREPGMRP